MKHIEFFRNKAKNRGLYLAESWEELGFRQITKLVLLAEIAEEYRNREVWEQVVQLCLNCHDTAWRKLVLSIDQWNLLKVECSWVFDTRLKHRPFDYFEHKGTRYFLPEPNFTDSDAIDVSYGNLKLVEFANPEGPNLLALDELVATFCRPERSDLKRFCKTADFNGDRREKFNDYRIGERAKLFADLDYGIKVAFLHYFLYTNQLFLGQYEELFGGGSSAPRYAGGEGWLMVLKGVAKNGVFGTFDSVCHKPAHLVWSFMLDDLLDSKDQEAEAEKMNSYASNSK